MRSRHLGLFGISIASCLASCLFWACDQKPPPQKPPTPQPTVETKAVTPPLAPKVIEAVKPAPVEVADGSTTPPAGPKPPRPPVAPEPAPTASLRLGDPPAAEKLRGKIDSYFAGHVGRRIHIQTDKPLYKPGETIWVRIWDLTTRAFSGAHKSNGMFVELVSPRGASLLKKKVHEQTGAGQIDFPLAAGTQGGEYTLRVRTLDGQKSERPVVVSSYEAPRLKLKLEFVRKAYGAGDEVNATIEVKRPTGEALKNHSLVAAIRLDGQDLPRVPLTTDDQGEGLVRFTLPQEIALGDGLLTVLCDEGGLTESIAKRVPIVLKKLSFAAYPEGGELIIGLPGRVYFEAKNPLGKPADVSGHVSDDTGAVVARFESVRDGLGRFDFSPQPGHQYHVEIDKPVGITEQYPMPPAAPEGCVLRSFDDLDGQLSPTRVSVRCTAPRTVHLTAMLRENLLDAATVEVPVGAPAVVYLEPRGQGSEATSGMQGVARVTVYDEAGKPLAERLIYRQRRARLGIKVTPDKKTYVPRDRVQLDLVTTDPKGNPVPADLALAVVDDTVLSFADDKTGHMLSRMYLEPELPGKIEEPNFYFSEAI